MVARMSRSAHVLRATVAAAVLAGATAGATGCGGKVPQHSGYKSKKAKPWEKAKALAFKKGEAEGEGDLSYAAYRRARWYALDLPADGELTVTLGQHGTNDRKVDIALEVLDGNNTVIGKADREDEDAFEDEKVRTLYELHAGRYLVHLYLQGRLDTAEYELKAKFEAKAVSGGAEFSAPLALLPPLPVVPIEDDTPIAKKKPSGPSGPRQPRPQPETPEKAPTGTAVNARIINVSVVDGGVEITVNRGTDTAGVVDGVKGRVGGVKNGEITLKGCGNRSCRAVVHATQDEVNGKPVTITP
jgi:hypothetical protein